MERIVLDKLLNILKIIKNYFLFTVIAVLLIFIYFKNIKIDNLTAKLAEKPTVEYVYNTKTDTIKVLKPYPVEVIKWKESVDTLYKPIDLNNSDSAKIAAAYKELFAKFGETKVYADVLKDDSTAYIKLEEKVQYNSISNRNLIFLDRTPVVYMDKVKNVYTTSLVGGIEAGTAGVEVGAGIITKRNTFMKVSYDPFNKTVRGGVYLSIFNFKSK